MKFEVGQSGIAMMLFEILRMPSSFVISDSLVVHSVFCPHVVERSCETLSVLLGVYIGRIV